MSHLVPCPGCTRHVRALEVSCPFCAATLGDATPLPAARPARRLGRLAMFTFGATLAASSVAVAGCGDDAEEPQQEATSGSEDGTTTPPADDGTTTPPDDSSMPPDDSTAPPDDGNVTTMYGGAPGTATLV